MIHLKSPQQGTLYLLFKMVYLQSLQLGTLYVSITNNGLCICYSKWSMWKSPNKGPCIFHPEWSVWKAPTKNHYLLTISFFFVTLKLCYQKSTYAWMVKQMHSSHQYIFLSFCTVTRYFTISEIRTSLKRLRQHWQDWSKLVISSFPALSHKEKFS